MKVLVVEDNSIIAIGHEMLIEDLGHSCATPATTSGQALEVACAETPDVAIVDLDLADGWTGPSLVEKLHRLGSSSIVVSGQLEYYDPPEHVLGTLAKPVNERDLTTLLEACAFEIER